VSRFGLLGKHNRMRGSGSAIHNNNHHDQVSLSAATQCDVRLFLHLLLLHSGLQFFISRQFHHPIIGHSFNLAIPSLASRPTVTSIRFTATMSNNPQVQPDVVSPVTSDQHWMRNPRCISCLARRLDIKDCPFYNVCPSCGSGPDTHGERCPFKIYDHRWLPKFFRLHPLEPEKNTLVEILELLGAISQVACSRSNRP
jgi:hypothetical protein